MDSSGVVLPPRHHSTTPTSIREMKMRASETVRRVGQRLLPPFPRFPPPLLLLLLVAAASSWPLITASSAVIKDGVTCKMCPSCDNPCQPSYSPPPPPDSPDTIFYWSPPPPSGYSSPPPPPYGGGGGGGGNPYFTPPTPGIYYPAPPPPNPVLPYFPFYYYSPYNSGSVPLKPLCCIPLLFLLLFLLL